MNITSGNSSRLTEFRLDHTTRAYRFYFNFLKTDEVKGKLTNDHVQLVDDVGKLTNDHVQFVDDVGKLTNDHVQLVDDVGKSGFYIEKNKMVSFLEEIHIYAPDIIEVMATKYRKSIIAAKEFDWLRKSDRACYYLFYKLKSLQPIATINLHSASNSTGLFYNIMYLFDDMNISLEEKLDQIRSHKKDFDIIKKRNLKHVEQSDYTVCDEVLNDILKMVADKIIKPSINPPSELNDRDKFDWIFILLDNIPDRHTRELAFSRLQQKQRNKKYQDNIKDSKRINVVVSKQTKSNFELLAKKSGENNAKLLEKLIQAEYERVFNSKKVDSEPSN